jgi:hypothetical protein
LHDALVYPSALPVELRKGSEGGSGIAQQIDWGLWGRKELSKGHMGLGKKTRTIYANTVTEDHLRPCADS